MSVSVEGMPATIHGIPAVLEEMVYNLCDNAIKYNRPGGSVALNLSLGEKEIELSVADTGIGIPAEDQERVFERFYRVDKSHSKEIGGSRSGPVHRQAWRRPAQRQQSGWRAPLGMEPLCA